MAKRMEWRRSWVYWVIGFFLIMGGESMARDFRTNLIPNGNVFSCNTCHFFPGGPRNEFGMEVEKLVTPGGRQAFWSPALAAMDSDGDGVSNGAELLDTAGTWKSGDPNPGSILDVTNPGDANSFTMPVVEEAGESYLCDLSGEKVVPAVNTPARGTAILELFAESKKLAYYLNVFDVSNITAAHIHLGFEGENGGVIHPFDTPVNGAVTGTLDITDDDIVHLQSGQFYVQVHTQQYPAGEIRGQATYEEIVFHADLEGSQEVPSNSSPGKGVAHVTLSNDLQRLSYAIDISGLNNITAAHFHTGERGVNGGVVIPIASAPFSQITGEADVTPEILANLLAEKLYINVHTAAFPAGEIRGQVQWEREEEPSGIADWRLHP